MRRERRPEDQLQDEVTAACGALPGVVLLDLRHVGKYARVYAGGYGPPVQIGRTGQPDLLLLVEGRALGLELKSAVGRVSAGQVTCHAAWGAMGTPVVVVRSVAEALMAIEARRA
jgi:hypothetical protein